MNVDKKAVGKRIKDVRLSLGLSMAKFGVLLGGIPRSSVNNWEHSVYLPGAEALNKIAEAGNTTNEYLLYGDHADEYILELLERWLRKNPKEKVESMKLQLIPKEEVKPMNLQLIGGNIRRLRKQKKMKQCELADAIGSKKSVLSVIEGGYHYPSCRTLEKLTKALGVTPNDLLC